MCVCLSIYFFTHNYLTEEPSVWNLIIVLMRQQEETHENHCLTKGDGTTAMSVRISLEPNINSGLGDHLLRLQVIKSIYT